MASDKAVEAQKLAEEQAKKVGQSVQQTKNEAEQLATSTGNSVIHANIVRDIKDSINLISSQGCCRFGRRRGTEGWTGA